MNAVKSEQRQFFITPVGSHQVISKARPSVGKWPDARTLNSGAGKERKGGAGGKSGDSCIRDRLGWQWKGGNHQRPTSLIFEADMRPAEGINV